MFHSTNRGRQLPPFPASMTQARIDLTVPIQFSLSGTAFAQERQHPAGCSLEINQQRRASIGNIQKLRNKLIALLMNALKEKKR